MERIGVIGATYRTASTEALAQASLPQSFPEDGLVTLARLAGFEELVYLGTCNRVEFYFRSASANRTRDILFHLRRSLADLSDGQAQLPPDDDLLVARGEEAVRHLFRVTAALDSMMVGEAQIAGQVKEAHERAHGAGILGGILDQAFHEAFHLAKRVRTETELARRPVSLVTLVERRLAEHLARTSTPVLILGAGEMAAEALKLLRKADPDRRVIVANRTEARAGELVSRDPKAHALPLEPLLAAPPAVGAVVAATSSEELLLTRQGVETIRARLPEDEPLLLVDLAMPPNLDPAAGDIRGVTYVGIESMRREAEENRRLRLAEIDRCEALIEHQLAVFQRRLLDRALSPVARALHRSYREIADRTLEQVLSRRLSHLAEEDRKAVEELTGYLLKRLVQVPLRGLKGAASGHGLAVLESFSAELGEDA